MFKPHYDSTENAEAILGTFSTTDATNNKLNGFLNEFFGSFILFFCALSITHSPIFEHGNQGAGFIGVGLLVMALVASFGGPTGPALNPARDLGPRILHAILTNQEQGNFSVGLCMGTSTCIHLMQVSVLVYYISTFSKKLSIDSFFSLPKRIGE